MADVYTDIDNTLDVEANFDNAPQDINAEEQATDGIQVGAQPEQLLPLIDVNQNLAAANRQLVEEINDKLDAALKDRTSVLIYDDVNHIVWNNFKPQNFWDAILNYNKAYSVTIFSTYWNVKEITFFAPIILYLPNVKTTNGHQANTLPTTLKELYMPSLQAMTSFMITDGMPLEVLDISSVTSILYNGQYNLERSAYLIDIHFGRAINASTAALLYWNPVVAMRNDTASLVHLDETFTSNREKLLYNIRNHIAANLKKLTTEGYSITFGTNIKNTILSDEETTKAFTDRGWTIS